MQTELALPPLFSNKHQLDPDYLGWLEDSSALIDDPEAMRQRIDQQGYLFLPGVLDRELVLESRRVIVQRLAQRGCLADGTDPMDAIAAPTYRGSLLADLAKDNAPLMQLLYAGRMMEIFRRLLDAPVRHFDYTWVRAVAPGKNTLAHCDSVYMNRGTLNLYTAWTPIGDVDFRQGGLIVLEGSNNHQKLRRTYAMSDVDSFCTNRTGRAAMDSWQRGHGGWLSKNPVQLRRSLGGRWLTSEFRAGDVRIFSIFTVHASLDNRSNRIRLSTDTRYQRADEPADERWIGDDPIAHGQAGKRGRIC